MEGPKPVINAYTKFTILVINIPDQSGSLVDLTKKRHTPTRMPRCIPEAAVEGREYMPEEQIKKQIGLDRFRVVSHPFYAELLKNSARVWGEDKPWGLGRTNYAAHAPMVYRSMVSSDPYPVRAAISLAANPLVTAANTKLVYKALKSLDLYIVSDFWMTPSFQDLI